MFRKYGLFGVILIILVELNFFFKIEPFASWYFPLVWIGYILLIDALVYKLRMSSLISNRFRAFLGMVVASSAFWFVCEFLNIKISTWGYSGAQLLGMAKTMYGVLSFATVLPAFFETVELIRTLHLFDKQRLHAEHELSRHTIHIIVGIGIISFILQLILPGFIFPLVWLSVFLILDPVNYLHKQPSVIGHLKSGRLDLPLSLLLAGIILGFFWEFWNYWAVIKWTYDIPFFGFFKIFEMPAFGYLGYFPFSFELYTMYWFTRSLFTHKEHLLAD